MFIINSIVGLLLIVTSYYFGFEYKITSPAYLIFLFLYVITSSISIIDIRMVQERKYNGVDWGYYPKWVNFIHLFDWVIAAILIMLNWKIYLIIFVARYILKVIPVLETIGVFLVSPFHIPPKNNN